MHWRYGETPERRTGHLTFFNGSFGDYQTAIRKMAEILIVPGARAPPFLMTPRSRRCAGPIIPAMPMLIERHYDARARGVS